jgi:long-chain acyl-CoA synthetase
MSVQTLPALFMSAVRERPRGDCFSSRDAAGTWHHVSSEEVYRRVQELRHGLKSLGVRKGDRVALLSENRLEWALSDLAALCQGAVVVPVYPTLLPEDIAYILQDCEPTTIFVSTAEQAAKIHAIRDRIPSLHDVISFDVTDLPNIMHLAKLAQIGANVADDLTDAAQPDYVDIGRDELASIIYTSGTTGKPKGVMLSHWNFVSNTLATMELFSFDHTDRALSFLPLSHVFERMAGYYTMLYSGVGIAYAEAVDTVPRDLLEVKPTIVISVPRLYEKIYARVMAAAAGGSGLKKRLFFWARRVGIEYDRLRFAKAPIPGPLALQQRIADHLVFAKLRARTGGNVRLFVSGGAPLSAKIAEFFHAAGLVICEGYGLTETSPVIACNTPTVMRIGSVGKAFPGTELKIADDGEILARGPQIMLGYYRNEAATREVLDADGWFATGDIGHFDDDGFLYITDRKKDLIVTAGGKNVAPQPIENAFKQSRFISQTVVIGDRRPYLSVLLVPDFEALVDSAAAEGLPTDDVAALLADPKVLALFQEEVDRVNAELPGFNQIKKFALLRDELTLAAGELTPTLKIKRFAVDRKYREVIDGLYPPVTQDDE